MWVLTLCVDVCACVCVYYQQREYSDIMYELRARHKAFRI